MIPNTAIAIQSPTPSQAMGTPVTLIGSPYAVVSPSLVFGGLPSDLLRGVISKDEVRGDFVTSTRGPVVRRPLGLPDELVGEVGDVALDSLDVDKAHGFLVAGLAEEALAGPEHDREDL
jgi:hypothetical protein